MEAARTDANSDATDNSIEELDDYIKYCTWAGVCLAICACCFLLCIMCTFKSLKLAIDIIDAASDFIYKTKRVVLVPVLYFLISVGVFCAWLACVCCVLSLNEIYASDGDWGIPQMRSLDW